MPASQPIWWKNGTCYQIWPASYKDSNGDGVGDIPGVISTLDYVQDLGVEMIWLCPMYDSPQHDMGYDVANYEEVWYKFGTLEDMTSLIQEVHLRGMKLILDLVVNHTSDQHKWFRESRKSKNNGFSDWYIWRDPKYRNGKRVPPNNWASVFGGSAWEYASERDQYYLHLFTPHQPDLNWENKATRAGIYDSAIKFWLDRGVDGFRVDTVNLYSKNVDFPDVPTTATESSYQNAEHLYVNGPRMHEWLKEQRVESLDKYGDVVLVGELPGTGADEVLQYISPEARELDMVFDFGICELGGRYGRQPHETWLHSLPELKSAFQKTQGFLDTKDAWTTVFAENHDQPRSLSMFGTEDPKFRTRSGRLLAILLATLSGTLFIYQGQEIGMTNVDSTCGPEYFKDVCGLNYLREMEEKYAENPQMVQAAVDSLRRIGRDNARTPFQWTAGPNAGFTAGEPWMPVNKNYEEINVESSQKDSKSVLAMWKRMLKLRKTFSNVLVHGQFEIHDFENPSTFTFVKKSWDMDVLVALNFTSEVQTLDVPPSLRQERLELLVTNVDEPQDVLAPWEGRVYVSRRNCESPKL